MAGAGVSVGGAGMLRARRRDVSVKPNRKLDRKSSRGMIYENEELRLRTIHINAEVEQGQNDIKKLRRENEQLRREIWSLRDEYDKLEDILKSQKNREGSEDYEDRSEDEDRDDDEEAEEHSDYSVDENEEAEEDCDEEEKDIGTNDEEENDTERNEEERLDNDENQKISSEKVNSSNHRLHVEFDDLSVVDEEEELKREKERKEVVPSGEIQARDTTKENDLLRMESRNNYQCFPPPRYGSSGTSGSGNPYYSDYPFVFPSNDTKEFTEMLPMESPSMLLSTCPGLYNDSFNHVPNFEPPCVANLQLNYGSDFGQDSNYGESPIGWQRNIFAPGNTFQAPEVYQNEVVPAQPPGMFRGSMFDQPGQSAGPTNIATATNIPRGVHSDEPTDSPGRIHTPVVTSAILPSLYQRRNLLQKQPTTFYSETVIPGRAEATGIEVPNSADALTRNGWDFGPPGNGICNARMYRDTDDRKNAKEGQRERTETGDTAMERDGHQRLEDSNVSGYETVRPKHFFAPLPAKIQHGRQDSSERTTSRTTNPGDSPSATFYETYGTGKSSSSERTSSTVISGRHFQPHGQPAAALTEIFRDSGEKGSADICVNGAVAGYANEGDACDTSEERTYKSSENLLIGNKDDSRDGSSRQGSNNPLVKSVSCQDLSSEPLQNALLEMARTFQTDNKSQKFAKSDNTLDNPATGSVKPFRSQLNVTLKCPYAENECGRYSPEIPEIPKLPTIDYRLFNNPFLKTFDPRGGNYGNYEICSPVTRPLSIQVNENSFDRGKSFQQQAPSIDYSSPVLTHSFARQLNLEEGTVKSTRPYTVSDVETDRHRGGMLSTTSQTLGVDPRIVASPKLRQEFQVTSFEQPNPRSLHQGLSSYDLESLRRLPTPATTPVIPNHRKLYQNVPFVPGPAGMFCPPPQNPLRMFYDTMTQKVPAQTQTSIDGGSNNGDEIVEGDRKKSKTPDPEETGNSGSPTSARRKRVARKERSTQKTDKRPLSPAAQRRRLRKQSSIDVTDVALDETKSVSKTKKFSVATANSTASEHLEDKNESRSSSSGQESPRKEHNRRVSTYFSSKKRPSLASVKTTRSSSVDNTKDNYVIRGVGESMDTTNSERERTNSASSREAATGKARKSSVSSGKVPWCACWGNGCV